MLTPRCVKNTTSLLQHCIVDLIGPPLLELLYGTAVLLLLPISRPGMHANGNSYALLIINGAICTLQRASEASGELIFAKPDHVGVQAFRPCAILDGSAATA